MYLPSTIRSLLVKRRSLLSDINFLHRCLSTQRVVDIQPAVREALQKRAPIVALESTIITHGMPWPNNVDTALEVEELVRANGATPATIAIMNGRIKVGLATEELRTLAALEPRQVIKCSRRDLPFVVANSLHGGTTVAATMLIAHMVGLKIFATGGIGGVHQQGHISMDVSADLIELGRTPIAVVCSGVKSILDKPRTLEYLETQGVCVATFGSPERRFPDFYTRDSGCSVNYNLETPHAAAQLILSLDALQLQSGLLIGVPIPLEFAADKVAIRRAIEEAEANAATQNISGKDVTPFLLAAIAKITDGKSLEANIALIKNNATVAARIAKAFYEKSAPDLKKANVLTHTNAATTKQPLTPLVIGGSILDFSLQMLEDIPQTLNGATYQTTSKQSAGGVARNIAEGVYKLYGSADFISAVGSDEVGRSLLQLTPEALRTHIAVEPNKPTSLCSLLFDKRGDCKLVLGNMEIHETITAERIIAHQELLRVAPLIIVDANLKPDTLESVLTLARTYLRPVFYEPTDMRICHRPFMLPAELWQQIKMISPNVHELKHIVEAITGTAVSWNTHEKTSKQALLEQTEQLVAKIEKHFDCIVVTLGEHGIFLNMRGSSDMPIFDARTGYYQLLQSDTPTHRFQRYYPANTVDNIVNVSGAGDSFASGLIAGMLKGYTIERCVALGLMAAESALRSDSAVPAKYFDNVESLLEKTFEKLTKKGA